MIADFRILVPRGWARIDAHAELAPQVRALAAVLADGVAGEGGSRRAVGLLVPALTAGLSPLVDQGVASILVPTTALSELPARPLIGIGPLRLPAGTAPMDALLAVAARVEGARVLDVDHLVALAYMTEQETSGDALPDSVRAAGLDPDREDIEALLRAGQTSLRLRYLIGDPDSADRWAEVTCSVSLPSGQPAEIARVRTDLSDMMDAFISTFRWVGA